MIELHPSDGAAADIEPLQPLLDWQQLLSAENPHQLLDRLAQALAPHVLEWQLSESGQEIATWRSAGFPEDLLGSPPHAVEVAGTPSWRLSGRFGEAAPQFVLLERALMVVEAWRSARHDLVQAENRVRARTKELDLIQALGRKAAEARDLDRLFRCAVHLLQDAEDIDIAVAAYAVGNRRCVVSYEARQVDDATRLELSKRATQLLGWPEEELGSPRTEKLSSWDADRGELREWSESSLVLLPVPRGERITACLVLLPARPAGEGSLRLCFAVSNQLSLHLDRILTVHEAEADRFRSILDSIPQAVLLLDRNLHVRQANPAAAEWMQGYDLHVGASMQETVESIGFGDLVDSVLRGEATSASAERRTSDDRTYSVSVSRLAHAGDGDAGLVVVLGDVSEARQMQLQLAHSEKMSSLGRMISGVTHELNNPLTSIMGYAQLLRAAVPDGKVARRAEMLESEARRCQKIVRNLLSFARKRETQFCALSLNEVAEAVISLMTYQLRVESIEVESSFDGNLPALHGDPHQLQQVLVNLLTNGQQAIRSVADRGTLKVRTGLTETHAFLEVQDDGPGIDEATRARIFDPFFTTKEDGQGTGLGLSLVYGIVRDHGGRIESLPCEDGALFRVELPLINRDASSLGFTSSSNSNDAAEKTPDEWSATRSVGLGRVLVVDDEAPIAQMICESLEERGHQTVSVAGGDDALEQLRLERFDLVIADLRMPGIGGEGLFERLQREHPRLATSMLFTTGDTAGDAAQDVAQRTGCELLTKPFDLDALVQAVEAGLSRTR